MRLLLKKYFFNTITLWLATIILPGVSYTGNNKTILLAGLALLILNLFIKPVLNILFLPINFLTMGLFRWVTTVIVIYLITILITSFNINPFTLDSFSILGIIIPPLKFGKLTALIAATFLISFINNFLHWVFKS